MWSNVFPHVDKGRFLFLIYFYEGVFNEKNEGHFSAEYRPRRGALGIGARLLTSGSSA